jgi:hypothetical protein
LVKILTDGAKICAHITGAHERGFLTLGKHLPESGGRRADHSDAMIKGVRDVNVALVIDRYPEGIVHAAI